MQVLDILVAFDLDDEDSYDDDENVGMVKYLTHVTTCHKIWSRMMIWNKAWVGGQIFIFQICNMTLREMILYTYFIRIRTLVGLPFKMGSSVAIAWMNYSRYYTSERMILDYQ